MQFSSISKKREIPCSWSFSCEGCMIRKLRPLAIWLHILEHLKCICAIRRRDLYNILICHDQYELGKLRCKISHSIENRRSRFLREKKRKKKGKALAYIKWWSAIYILCVCPGYTIHDIPLTGTGITYYRPVIILIRWLLGKNETNKLYNKNAP